MTCRAEGGFWSKLSLRDRPPDATIIAVSKLPQNTKGKSIMKYQLQKRGNSPYLTADVEMTPDACFQAAGVFALFGFLILAV